MLHPFPVMQFETKYGIDFRVGANEANIRSGSKLIGYLPATDKKTAIRMFKHKLELAIDDLIWHK
jgi:hypothetical protein